MPLRVPASSCRGTEMHSKASSKSVQQHSAQYDDDDDDDMESLSNQSTPPDRRIGCAVERGWGVGVGVGVDLPADLLWPSLLEL